MTQHGKQNGWAWSLKGSALEAADAALKESDRFADVTAEAMQGLLYRPRVGEEEIRRDVLCQLGRRDRQDGNPQSWLASGSAG